jgi:23S rRNA (guanosine2251-2'-O)-methyltransferase
MNLICGINPVLEALQAGTRQFDRLLVVKGLRNRRVSEAIARAGHIGVPLRFETRDTLDRLASGVPHQGIIAVVSPKPVMGVDELLATARQPALVVVLDGVEDPRNLGAILRTVEASGADGVLLPDRHSAGLSDTVARASAGALEHVKVARIGNVSQTLDHLKERGLWVIGLDAAGGERWDKVDFTKPVALVLGGEGRGIRRLVREHCDQLVALPLFGHVTSLNVSVAAGAVLYEVIRQRGLVPSHVRPIPPSARPHASNHITGPAVDDPEADPGALNAPRAADEPDDDEAADNLSLVEIHEGEDPAWRLPESAPPAERRGITRTGDGREGRREGHREGHREGPREGRGRRQRRDRDRPGREGRPEGQPASSAPGNEAPREDRGRDRVEGPGGGGPGDEQRRRRRRRRRPRPGGPSSSAPGSNGGGEPRGPSGGGEPGSYSNAGSDAPREPGSTGAGGPGPGGPGERGPGGDRNGRRRRRRRRRRPTD